MTLLELAARPEYQSLLRDEIHQVVLGEGVGEGGKEGEKAKSGGWTLASIDRLHKLDSFMCETRRMWPTSDSTVPFTHSTETASSFLSVPPHTRSLKALADGRRLRLDAGNSTYTPPSTERLHLLGRHVPPTSRIPALPASF